MDINTARLTFLALTTKLAAGTSFYSVDHRMIFESRTASGGLSWNYMCFLFQKEHLDHKDDEKPKFKFWVVPIRLNPHWEDHIIQGKIAFYSEEFDKRKKEVDMDGGEFPMED